MNNRLRITLFWILAVVITISAAIYQRKTGPTYPKRVELNANNTIYNLKLVRSHGEISDCPVVFEIPDNEITANLSFRRFPTNDNWNTVEMKRDGIALIGNLPHQPMAGKIEYKVDFFKNGDVLNDAHQFHSVVRYTGSVPSGILIPHIFFIFFAMLLSNFTGILAIAKHEKALLYGYFTLAFLTLGGMVFGPFVQLYAFGDLWTGVPFGWDLTDNKTLIAFVMWIVALIMYRKQKRLGWLIAAAVVMALIFLIPHSMFGSELDYSSGTVTQG